MLHVLMLLSSLGLTLLLRWQWVKRYSVKAAWIKRWRQSLLALVLPPLLLMTTSIALLLMGPICHMGHHQMVHGWPGILTYGWAWSCLGYFGLTLLLLLVNAGRSWWRLRALHTVNLAIDGLESNPVKLLDSHLPFVAQIGLWQPQLVVSQGLLSTLDAEHLQAVLQHEAAHRYYRDTFWFAVVGWLRQCSAWLPHTTQLWEELLLLRELRADRWAARQVDPLLLAEALFELVRAPQSQSLESSAFAAAFNEVMVSDRFSERVDALLADDILTEEAPNAAASAMQFVGMTLPVGWPLLSLFMHH